MTNPLARMPRAKPPRRKNPSFTAEDTESTEGLNYFGKQKPSGSASSSVPSVISVVHPMVEESKNLCEEK